MDPDTEPADTRPIMAPRPGSTLVMLYDGRCAVCTTTAAYVRRRDRSEQIECADLQDPLVAARFPTLSAEAVREQLHAVDREGTVSIGVDALRVIGGLLPRWRWVAWLLGVPGVRWVVERFYLLFARNRYVFNPLLARSAGHTCDEHCTIDLGTDPP